MGQGISIWEVRTPRELVRLSRMLKNSRLLTRPTPARLSAALPILSEPRLAGRSA